jgi:hypothetical protein
MALRVEIHSHARERAPERGASEEEIVATVLAGETFPARFGRVGFRRNFRFNGIWRGKRYATKQVEAYAVEKLDHWLVITVITKYFESDVP